MENNRTENCVNCGIKCSAANCVHHTTDDCCKRNVVEIGTHSAHSASETVCTSFECRD